MRALASAATEILDTLPAVARTDPNALKVTPPAESGLRATPLLSHGVPTGWEGKRLDHFEIERPLARGGMGAVFRARDRSLDRTVAIKLLLDELADRPQLHE